MAATEQDSVTNGTTGANTISVSWTSAPAEGELLISAVSIDKAHGGLTGSGTGGAPTGWTLIFQDSSAQMSIAMAWKIAGASESSTVVWDWTTTTPAGEAVWAGAYTGIDSLDVFATTFTDDSDVSSVSSGTTATLASADSFGVACLAVDTWSSWGSGATQDNGYVTEATVSPQPGLRIAVQDGVGTGAQETTFTATSGADAASAGIAIFYLAGGASISTVTPSEFDFDNTDVDIVGAGFETPRNTGTVYLSDASTLAGSANEKEIDGAVNTWADALVNLNFSGLSQAEIDSLHTLGPGTSRWIILTNDTGDEGSFQITLHRPQALEMVLSPNFAPSVTTARLTGMSGTFGGGRIEETAAQNPSTTTTNVASDGNREDVWNMQVKANAREVSYDFRVLYDGVVADTVTQTPQLTVSFAAPFLPYHSGIPNVLLRM